MKVAIINDTNGPHAGCQLVHDAYLHQLRRIGATLLGTVHKSVRNPRQYPDFVHEADLLIVNGEGSIHHGARQELINLAQRFPAVLINCVYQDNPPNPALSRFRLVAARESLSAAALAQQGIDAFVVPDIILTSPLLRDHPRNPPSLDLGFTDNVLDTATGISALVGPGAAINFLDELCRYRRICAGRFHAALMAASLGIPFSAWASNTHKTLGLMRDMGVEHRYAESRDAAASLAPEICDPSVVEYVRQARDTIDALFDRLRELV